MEDMLNWTNFVVTLFVSHLVYMVWSIIRLNQIIDYMKNNYPMLEGSPLILQDEDPDSSLNWSKLQT